MILTKKHVLMIVDEKTGEVDGCYLQNGGGRMIPYTLSLAKEEKLMEWHGTTQADQIIPKENTV